MAVSRNQRYELRSLSGSSGVLSPLLGLLVWNGCAIIDLTEGCGHPLVAGAVYERGNWRMGEQPAREQRNKNLGALLREARTEAGQSRISCANFLNISTQTIAELEAGEVAITAAQLETLADFLDVPLVHFWSTEIPPLDEGSEVEDTDIVQERLLLRQKLIGVQLRQARLAAGKTQKECAEQIDVSPKYIVEYEYGRLDIPLAELEVLSDFLGTPMESFIDFEPEHERPSQEVETLPPDFDRDLESPDGLGHLTPEVRAFVEAPGNSPYLRFALRVSRLSASALRGIGEGLLEITH